MAWVAHVWVDTTVSTVCSSSLLGRLVHLDVLDHQVTRVETFCVGVGFGVAEEVQEEFGGFDGVPGPGDTECFACAYARQYGSCVGCLCSRVFRLLIATPSRLGCSCHTLCASSSATSVSPHGDGLLHLFYILQVLDRPLNLPAIDCLCGFSGVLEADSEV